MLPEIESVSLYGNILFTVVNIAAAFQCVEIKYSLANKEVLDSS